METYEQERDEAAELHENVKYKNNTDIDYYGVSDSFKAGADWANARAKKVIAEKDALIFMPGVFRCAKCNCQVIAQTIYMKSGNVGPNDKPQECPNNCGPMWKTTWKDDAKDSIKKLEALSEKLASRDAMIEKLEEGLKKLGRHQHNGFRHCCCDILGKIKAELEEWKKTRCT